MSTEITTLAPPAAESAPVKGLRVNGKQWKPNKTPFRKNAGLTSYAKRADERKALDAIKAKEKEMKEEKEAERQRRIEALRKKRADKEERERYEKMAEKMHRKRVERLKRREKRNKLLKS
ncbi:hypothetical protein K490DRAFT_56084 [Saccharata proteae CBS 121410]|uniref:rRNA-processing protein n=1 Tax=Saccharata proteae CBS 121410 TaxID=1314787 RepID=A0A9P4HU28_9PEZI|nr:hypothetical protein K490DRAFT_56084 [Saccharata proteae CBS 121410]